MLEDAYGNRFTYAHLGSVAQLLPRAEEPTRPAGRPRHAGRTRNAADPTPTAPASAGSQPETKSPSGFEHPLRDARAHRVAAR